MQERNLGKKFSNGSERGRLLPFLGTLAPMQAQPKPQRLLRFHSAFLPRFSKRRKSMGSRGKKSNTPSRNRPFILSLEKKEQLLNACRSFGLVKAIYGRLKAIYSKDDPCARRAVELISTKGGNLKQQSIQTLKDAQTNFHTVAVMQPTTSKINKNPFICLTSLCCAAESARKFVS